MIISNQYHILIKVQKTGGVEGNKSQMKMKKENIDVYEDFMTIPNTRSATKCSKLVKTSLSGSISRSTLVGAAHVHWLPVGYMPISKTVTVDQIRYKMM